MKFLLNSKKCCGNKFFQCSSFKAKTKLKGYSEKVVIDGRNNFKSQKNF